MPSTRHVLTRKGRKGGALISLKDLSEETFIIQGGPTRLALFADTVAARRVAGFSPVPRACRKPIGWRLTENRAMLICNERSCQAHCGGGW
jgi:hypothetical protein